MMRKCYNVNRSSIDESNESVRRNWIVFRHGIVTILTSAAEYLGKYEKLWRLKRIIQLLNKSLETYHNYFIYMYSASN